MSRKTVVKILVFLITSVASFACMALLYTLFNYKSFLPASPIVDDVPYKDYTNSDINIAVTLTEPKLIVLLEFDLDNEQLSIMTLPGSIVGSDLSKLSSDDPKQSLENLVKVPIDRMVTMDGDGLMSLVNNMGGIETTVKYAIPFSKKYGATVDEGAQRITGAQLVLILNNAEQPSTDTLNYYSSLIADLTKNLLSDFTKNDYYQFLNTCSTDISYPDYYNYKAAMKDSIKNITVLPAEGNWKDQFFHLN